MIAKIEFPVTAKNGSLKLLDREILVTFLESNEGKSFVLQLKEIKSVRSLGWNNYYWAVVIPHVRQAMVEVGYDPDQLDSEIVHDYLKDRFLKVEIWSEGKQEMLKVVKRTSKLDNKEFAIYIAQIQKWATEFLSIYIPDPNEGLGIGMKT